MRILAGIFCTLFLLYVPAHAQSPSHYERFNDPTVEMDMTRNMMYPTVLVRTNRARGSGTVLFSGYVEESLICKLEPPVAKDSVPCAGKEQGRQIRTYVLSAWHVVEGIFANPHKLPPKLVPPDGKKDKDKDKKAMLDMQASVAPQLPPLSIIVRVASSTGEMETSFARYEAMVVAKDVENDLVVLSVKHTLPFTAWTAPRDVKLQPFRPVWALGAPLGFGPLATEGILSGTKEEVGKKRYLLSAAPIYGGNSGGGLFHYSKERYRFELIAVNRAIGVGPFGPVPHIVLSIPIGMVHDFLEKHSLGFIAQ